MNNHWPSLIMSRSEGLFVGGSSGSALSGALKFLKSSEGQEIAQDADANVVIILPDGVRNYMSKPWFLDVAQDPTAEKFKGEIRHVLGRDLNDPNAVVERAGKEGKTLENGDALANGVKVGA